MSSNPFRRSQPPPAANPPQPRADSLFPASLDDDASPQSPPQPRKPVRVTSPPQSPQAADSGRHDNLAERIRQGSHTASPPPLSPDGSSETVQGSSGDPFDRAADFEGEGTEDGELTKDARRNSGPMDSVTSPSGAPANPFQRTLANIEPHAPSTHTQLKEGRQERAIPGKGPSHAARASLDVDAFKRLLMTGSSAPAPSGTPPSAVPQLTVVTESGSSTDASSVSRQSLFEPIQEQHAETPRTSYDHSISEDDDRTNLAALEVRKPEKKKPPPPKHRHGKLVTSRTPQTVSFSDFAPSFSSPTAATPPRPAHHRSNSDMNKPLPPPPPTASNQPREMKQPTPPIKESNHLSSPPLNASPVFAEPTSGQQRSVSDSHVSPPPQKRAPPPVPLSRRHSQLRTLNPSHTRSRSNSGMTISSQHSDSGIPPPLSPSLHKSAPPPPPPSRRHRGNGNANHTDTTPSSAATSVIDFPAVSRPRGTSASSVTSPTSPSPGHNQVRNLSISNSNTSISSLGSPNNASTSHSTTGMGPPPPPPPRARGSSRSSFDTARPLPAVDPSGSSNATAKRPSVELNRVSIEGRQESSAVPEESGDDEVVVGHNASAEAGRASRSRIGEGGLPTEKEQEGQRSSIDVLADMERFQAEVDALRQRYGRGSTGGG